MEKLSEESGLLAALRSGSASAFEDLYRDYYRMAEDLVVRYHGTPEDARDVFQETLFVLVKKIREPDFRLSGKLSTYLYAIIRNIWLKKAGKTAPEIRTDHSILSNLDWADAATKQDISPQEKEDLLAAMKEKMSGLEEDCRNLLRYSFYQNLPHAEIAVLTGYTEAFVKVKKFRCLGYLRRMLKDTQIFKNL
ncbi:MAG: sigma-70 family RNA polymerase sigma factor [Lewinellaceae bacterium]|nr:sigma-70 family RNA polymerase sigma factor [Saprospiraceae bacterium]MCB9337774.1 sigma-70 family RNA polymerase sigma factor [Lewinellaceae bacterium]